MWCQHLCEFILFVALHRHLVFTESTQYHSSTGDYLEKSQITIKVGPTPHYSQYICLIRWQKRTNTWHKLQFYLKQILQITCSFSATLEMLCTKCDTDACSLLQRNVFNLPLRKGCLTPLSNTLITDRCKLSCGLYGSAQTGAAAFYWLPLTQGRRQTHVFLKSVFATTNIFFSIVGEGYGRICRARREARRT